MSEIKINGIADLPNVPENDNDELNNAINQIDGALLQEIDGEIALEEQAEPVDLAAQFEQIEIPMLKEALTEPSNAAGKILSDPTGIGAQIEQKMAEKKTAFSFWEKLFSVLSFGIAYPFIRDSHIASDNQLTAQNRQEAEGLRKGVEDLQKALKTFPNRQECEQNFTICGNTLTLRQEADNTLFAVLHDGEHSMTVRLPLNALQLRMQLEDDITHHAPLYGREAVDNVLHSSELFTFDEVAEPEETTSRYRTLLTNVITSSTTHTNVDFSNMPTEVLKNCTSSTLAHLHEPVRAETEVNKMIQIFTDSQKQVGAKDKINSVLTSELLAKLDQEDQLKEKVDIQNFALNEQQKISAQRQLGEQKLEMQQQYAQKHLDYIDNELNNLNRLDSEVKNLQGLDRLCRKLYTLKVTEEQIPGQALAVICKEESRMLATLLANRTLLNHLPDQSSTTVKALLQICEKHQLKTAGMIAKFFTVPERKITLDLGFWKKELENTAFLTFQKTMEAELGELEHGLLDSTLTKTQQLCATLFTEFNKEHKNKLETVSALLNEHASTLQLLHQDNKNLDALPQVLKDLIEQIASTNPDFAKPLTVSQAAAQPLLDLISLHQFVGDIIKIKANPEQPGAAEKQFNTKLQQNPELVFKLADAKYSQKLIAALPPNPPLLQAVAGVLSRQMQFMTRANNENRINSFEEYKQVLSKLVNFDPKADTANLSAEEKKIFNATQKLYESNQRAVMIQRMEDLAAGLIQIMTKRTQAGDSALTYEVLREYFAPHVDLLLQIFRSTPVDFIQNARTNFAQNIFNLLKDGSQKMLGLDGLSKLSDDVLKNYLIGIFTNEPGSLTPEMKSASDAMLSQLSRIVILPGTESQHGLEPLFITQGSAQYKAELLSKCDDTYKLKIIPIFGEYQRELYNLTPLREAQQEFELSLQHQKVHSFLADLILNFDGSKYDAVANDPKAKPGTRILKTILEHVGTFNRLISDPNAINSLPDNMRPVLKEALDGIRGNLLFEQLQSSELWTKQAQAQRNPNGSELLSQLKGSPLFAQVEPRDPPGSDDYTAMVMLAITNKLLPADSAGELIGELHRQGLITESDARACFSFATTTYQEGEQLAFKPPFAVISSQSEQVLHQIIEQKLLPLPMLENLVKVFDKHKLLGTHSTKEIMDFATQQYGESKITVADPFMLAEPDTIKMAAQQIILTNRLNEVLTNPKHEMWNRLAEAEQTLNNSIDEVSNEIASEISSKFEAALNSSNDQQVALDPTNKDVTLTQLQNEATGSFAKTALGQFMGQVMNSYFKDMSAVDKRSMLASMIRYSNAKSTPGQVLGAMFKGAGPIMQKMLQRLPAAALTEDLKIAFADMKSNLAPIPERIIQAHLLDLVNSSQGEISKISVVKSLGAASVGQAVLCKFYTKDHPEGIEKVIKFLRPDVQNRAEREKQIFREAAKKVPGMDVTFEGDLKTIMEELDLTVEARNIESGQIYSDNSPQVKSMTLSSIARPTSDVMVLDLAPGTTLDRCIKENHEQMLKNLQPFTHMEGPNHLLIQAYQFDGRVSDDYNSNPFNICLNAYNELSTQYQNLLKQQQNLISFTKNWVTEGIFGKGFYHGDLHAGNIMTSPEMLTIIDFGNCTQLTEEQQLHITKMMAAAMFSDGPAFTESLIALLSEASKARLNEHMDKNNPDSPLVKDRLDQVISAVLSKGTDKDAGSRILVALQEVLKLGIEMPAPIYNFSKCQMALNNAIEETNQTLQEIYTAMRIAAYNVDKNASDPVSTLMQSIGADPSTNVEQKTTNLNNNVVRAKNMLNGDNYRQFVLDMLDGKKSDPIVEGCLKVHLEGHPELTAQYEAYQVLVQRRTEVKAALDKIPATGSAAGPQAEEENQHMRELISHELASVDEEARKLFGEFFEPLKAVVAQAIDDVAEKARQAVQGAKGYDDFLICMAEVLNEKRQEALSKLGLGKTIKYSVPLIFDMIMG